jgi:signal transduction histidine kinase/NO-binding membrane sensor protein with MHYT domain/CheY-like chemotaxis protein
MFSSYFCTTHQHDLWLVGLAFLVSWFATATAARLMMHAGRARRKARLGLFLLSGVCGGVGVWAAHFICMLAMTPGMQTDFDLGGTFASLAIALGGGAWSVFLSIKAPRRWADLTWSLAFGLSVAAMHYMGMAAMRLPAHLSWNLAPILASVPIGVSVAMTARIVARRMKSRVGFPISTALIVAATFSMHFLGMAAVTITPDAGVQTSNGVISHDTLALAVSGLVALVALACLGCLWVEALSKASSVSLLRNIIEVMPQGLAYFDADDRYILGNETFRREVKGYGVELRPGMTFRQGLSEAAGHGRLPAPAGREQAYIDAAMTHLLTSADAHERVASDGRVLRIENKRTHNQGMVTVVSDITDLKRQAAALATARDVAEAADKAKSAFLANMSHELRTPMNGVIAVAELLAAEVLTPRKAELVELIRSSSATLERVLCDVLDITRIEAGELEIRNAPFELVGAVEDALLPFSLGAAKKGLTLDLEGAPSKPCYVLGDEVRIKQVLGNLLSNAIKFTSEGQVKVNVAVAGERVVFTVTDTGIGFDVAQSDRLFNRFEQADSSSTRAFDGAGLGLSIARAVVDSMGGRLTCDSTPGVGSTFTLALPLRAAFAPQVAVPAPAESNTVDAAGPAARILVVDDNPTNQRVLALMLEGAGIETNLAANGQEAVELWAAAAFDAILMDIQMPVMDGLAAVRTIRDLEAERGSPPTPIVMVSANAMPEHVAASLRAGANGHVAKPVTADRLFAALEQLEDLDDKSNTSTAQAA